MLPSHCSRLCSAVCCTACCKNVHHINLDTQSTWARCWPQACMPAHAYTWTAPAVVSVSLLLCCCGAGALLLQHPFCARRQRQGHPAVVVYIHLHQGWFETRVLVLQAYGVGTSRVRRAVLMCDTLFHGIPAVQWLPHGCASVEWCEAGLVRPPATQRVQQHPHPHHYALRLTLLPLRCLPTPLQVVCVIGFTLEAAGLAPAVTIGQLAAAAFGIFTIGAAMASTMAMYAAAFAYNNTTAMWCTATAVWCLPVLCSLCEKVSVYSSSCCRQPEHTVNEACLSHSPWYLL
jgi:hypothetical protein